MNSRPPASASPARAASSNREISPGFAASSSPTDIVRILRGAAAVGSRAGALTLESSAPSRRSRLRDWGIALTLFVVVAAAYRASPQRYLLDAKYALLNSEALLTAGSWNLAPYLPHELARLRGEERGQGKLWQLRRVEDRLVYVYPPGTPLFSTVPLALYRLGGATTLDRRGQYDLGRELRLQQRIAALLGAGAVLLSFFLARRELPFLPALAVALVAAFGSGYWSVVSRVLWSHAWTAVLLSGALLELVRWEAGEKPRPSLLGALLAAAFWVRPTNAIAAVAFTAVVAIRHRHALARLVAVGAAGLVLYLVYSQQVWLAWLPSYFDHIVPRGRLDPPAAFLGQLFSAEHGLLVFSPVLLAVAWVLARKGFAPDRRGAAWISLLLVAVYVVYHSWRRRWWGAGAIGPRFLCDVTPFLVWLGAHAWRRAREQPAGGRLRVALTRAVVALLALAGAAAHATGALDISATALGRAPSDRHGREIAALGSTSYWRRLPQLGTARYLVGLCSVAPVDRTDSAASRPAQRRRRGG